MCFFVIVFVILSFIDDNINYYLVTNPNLVIYDSKYTGPILHCLFILETERRAMF